MCVTGRITGLRRMPPDFLLFSSGRQINLEETVAFGDRRPATQKPSAAGSSSGTAGPNGAVVAEVGRIMDRLLGLDG